ncbi:hypothetical protein F0L74_13570 [Chitinophaga agrisoli]|uniref:Uncharacterized protein n=1 Tax=Chitinophaga agrisoli TaxID=2607653 RepID=A0A5B2VZ44_9BACT|nr:hypothetical protein [Chitinophaga agrisoli]KAA2243516.1 hypothetical protein F0L74_13570 [Chitinophaga agrisoli]
MSTPKKGKLPQEGKEKLAIDPLKEDELGQIEGGFSEISQIEDEQESAFNGISCKTTNKSGCGATTE